MDTLPNPVPAPLAVKTLAALAAATVLLHLTCSNGYGYFRDELYAIACSRHLAWGYVDQPPFSELALAVSASLLGYSRWALHVLPALCGGAVTFLMGLIAKEMGGGRFAQVLAAVAYMVGGVFLAIANYYSMNCFDHLFWALGIYLLVRILKGGDTRLWILFGLVAGVGLENKYSMGFLGAGVVVGLALTPARKHFADKWLWVGGALAALIFLPHVLWEVHNHFPTAEFIRNVTEKKNLPMTPWEFMAQSALMVNPVALPIWACGLAYLLFAPQGRRFRLLGLAWITVLAILLSTHSKPYYFAPAFLLPLPAGAEAIEAFLERRQWEWAKPAYLAALALGGAVLAPLVLPVLPPATFVRYQHLLRFRAAPEERGEGSLLLPQFLADRFGWPEMVQQVAAIYHQLRPAEQAECVIGASDYGEAGAIDFFGKQYGLPNAVSTHNNYWFWGPGDKPGTVLLVVGGSREGYQALYDDVQLVGRTNTLYAEETNRPIFLCRRPKVTLQEYWKHHHDFI